MHLVLPEGKAESELVGALIEAHGLGERFELAERGSDSEFQKRLEAYEPLISGGKYTAIIIVADNDGNPSKQFRRMCNQIRRAANVNIAVPGKPWKLVGSDPRVAVLMLPSSGVKGTIETLITEALSVAYGAEAKAAKEFIAKMPNGQTNFPVPVREKARCAALVAATCRKNPAANVYDLWQANKNYRGALKSPAFDPLVAFLRAL